MNNGQISTASIAAAVPFIAQDAPAATVAAKNGTPQKGGDFAGVLNGAQLSVEKNTSSESDQTAQPQAEIGKNADALDVALQLALAAYLQTGMVVDSKQVPLPADVEQNATMVTEQLAALTDPAVKPVELLPVDGLQNVAITTEQVVAQKQQLPEATPASTVSLVAPVVSPVIELPVDMLQNVVMATEPVIALKQQQPEATSMPTVSPVAQLPVDTLQNIAMPTEVVIAQNQQQPEAAPAQVVSPVAELPVDRLQNVPMATEAVITLKQQQPEATPAPTVSPVAPVVSPVAELPVDRLPNVSMATEAVIVQKQQQPEATPAPTVSPVVPVVSHVALTPVNRLQNVATATEPVLAQKQQQPEATPAPIVSPVALLAADRLRNIVMPTEPVSAQKQHQPETVRTTVGDAPQAKTELVAAVPALVVSAKAESIATSPAPSLEPDAETKLSQPAPITARVAAAQVSAAETLTIRQRLGSNPQTEKVVDLGSAKEAESMPNVKPFGGSLMVASESSSSSDNSQGQSDVAGDNPDTAQNLSGQPMAEQHKASAAPAKLSPTEPLRQDIAEQVVPQLKERLDQHDIKAGKQQITLTLSPDSLGEIKMNLNLQGQKLSIEIVTEHRSVREAIMQNVDALKDTLARQNITMESFDVTTGGKGSGNQGQNQNAWRELMQQQQQQQQQNWTSSRSYTVAQAVPLSEAAIQQRRLGESMLDIHY